MAKNISTDSGIYVNFPSNAASNKDKDSLDFGMQAATAIEQEWFRKESNYNRFYANRQRYHSLRLYANGDQDIRRYKDEFSLSGDLSYLNLDWKPVPIIPKFVDIVVNGMADRDYEVKAQAVDPVSATERKRYIERLRGEMENVDTLKSIEQQGGVNVFENDPNNLPENEEELQVKVKLDYKQSIEVAVEAALNYELELNKYDTIKNRVDHDLVTIGIGCAKHTFNPTEGIKMEYVDPSNLVHSWSESKYLDDCFYFGELKRVHITEIQKMFPHLTSDEIDEIVKSTNRGTYYDFNSTQYNYDENTAGYIDLLYFSYKTVNNEIYKIKETLSGGLKAIEKDEDFRPPKDKRGNFDRTHKAFEVIYEGIKVLGYNKMLKWELAKNMMRPNHNSPKVVMPYVAAQTKKYKGSSYSLVRRMEKYADQIQLIHLKIQQVIQRMTPSGVYLDADGLAEIDLGNGSSYNPQEALNMYFQTGSVVGRSLTDSGDFNHGRVPIQELPGSDGRQIQTLLASYEYNLQQIRNVTGLNEARDGTDPDAKALVGVQKLAAANSNVATRHILDAGMYITKNLCEGITLRIKDIIEYSPMKDDYINAIGHRNVEILEELGKVHLSDFGIFLDLGPDEEEKAFLEANIQAALAKDQLKPEDAIDIRRVKDYKLASQLLKYKREKREKVEFERSQEAIKNQAQANAQSAQAAEQAKAQAKQIEIASESKLEQLKSQLRKDEQKQDEQVKLRLMQEEFNLNVKLNQMNNEYQASLAKQEGEMKADMEKQKVTANPQSSPRKGFESAGNDSISPIDLSKYEPK